MLNMLGAVAQFERFIIREREAEGIAKAVVEGKYKGRKPNNRRSAKIRQFKESGMSTQKVVSELNCNPSTVQRALKQHTL
jgi:DNA invertase Pin-like site-specific DNA recombinase